MIAKRASLCRRIRAAATGIRHRMFVATVRRKLGRLFPGLSWTERQGFGILLWDEPGRVWAVVAAGKL